MNSAQPLECSKHQDRDPPQSKSIIPSTRIASSLVMFTGGFGLVVACTTRRATTSPYAITQSASVLIGQGSINSRIPQGMPQRSACNLMLANIPADGDRDIPNDDPRYTFHRIVVQMIMDGIQLRGGVSAREHILKMTRNATKSLTTASFSFSTWTRGPISMYARTASYKPFRLASLQNNSGTSRTLDARFTSLLSLNSFPGTW